LDFGVSASRIFPSTYDGVMQVLKRLRGQNGCPWDKEQTHESLKEALLEECYELVEAIEEGDTHKMSEELGDVILNVAFHANIAEEQGEFTSGNVFAGLIDKLVRRHPHVFSGVKVSGSAEVVANWDAIKQRERGGADESALGGVPKAMPALSYAQTIQRRAARTGFDWEDFKGVLDKVSEEVAEIHAAESDVQQEQELGDLLFSVVNACRWMGVEAETALRHANARFYGRFTGMESFCSQRDIDFRQLSLDEKEGLWQEVKAREGEPGIADQGD